MKSQLRVLLAALIVAQSYAPAFAAGVEIPALPGSAITAPVAFNVPDERAIFFNELDLHLANLERGFNPGDLSTITKYLNANLATAAQDPAQAAAREVLLGALAHPELRADAEGTLRFAAKGMKSPAEAAVAERLAQLTHRVEAADPRGTLAQSLTALQTRLFGDRTAREVVGGRLDALFDGTPPIPEGAPVYQKPGAEKDEFGRTNGWEDLPPVPAEAPKNLRDVDVDGPGLVTPRKSFEDMRDQVFYYVMIDRFGRVGQTRPWGDANDARTRHGGNIEGLISKLDYLHGLGVTTVVVSPLQMNTPAAYHGYSPIHRTAVEPALGTMQTLQTLKAELEKRGMFLVVDRVFNQTGPILKYKDGFKYDETPKKIESVRFPLAPTELGAMQALTELGVPIAKVKFKKASGSSQWSMEPDRLEVKFKTVDDALAWADKLPDTIGGVAVRVDPAQQGKARKTADERRIAAQIAAAREYFKTNGIPVVAIRHKDAAGSVGSVNPERLEVWFWTAKSALTWKDALPASIAGIPVRLSDKQDEKAFALANKLGDGRIEAASRELRSLGIPYSTIQYRPARRDSLGGDLPERVEIAFKDAQTLRSWMDKVPPTLGGVAARFEPAQAADALALESGRARLMTSDHFSRHGDIDDWNSEKQKQSGDLPGGIPRLASENPATQDLLIKETKWWMRESGEIGARVDALPHLAPNFLERMFPETRDFAAKKLGVNNYFYLGELFEGDPQKYIPWLKEGRLDAAYNYISYYWNDAALHGEAPTAVLEGSFHKLGEILGSGVHRLVNFLGNHDRLHFLRPNDPVGVLHFALSYVFTSIGMPYLYGEEQAPRRVPGRKWLDIEAAREDRFEGGKFTNPASVDHSFDTNSEGYKLVSRLAEIRRDHAALRRGEQYIRWSDPTGPGIFAFSRIYRGEEVVVVLNSSNAEKSALMYVDAGITPPGTELVDAMDGTTTITSLLNADGGSVVDVKVPAYGTRIFVRKVQ